jgi:alcohol dehydrogenase class IV/acyl carrier protein
MMVNEILIDDIKNRLYGVISRQFLISESDITDEIGPGDLAAWDSIGQLQLILAIEKAFDLQLSVNDVMSINNVKDIIDVLIKYSQSDEKVLQMDQKQAIEQSVFHPLMVPGVTYWGNGSLSVLNSFNYKRVALVTGTSSYAMRLVDRIRKMFPGVEFQDFHRTHGEPNENGINELALKLQSFSPDCIIAAGGGSTIDSAKLSWLLYEKPEFDLNSVEHSIYDFQLRHKASLIAVPTTFGSGSEVSSAATFTKTNQSSKTILVSHDFIADKVILDPALGEMTPLPLIYASAFDSLVHAIEGYVSIVNNPLLDPNAIMAVKNILSALNKLKNKGLNGDILETLCYASYYAGIVQNHCSVGLTHSFAHQLWEFGVGHGQANALFLKSVIEYNSTKTDKYTGLVSEIGFASVGEFIDEVGEIILEANIFPDRDIINSILDKKNKVVEGAINDVTFRTNPVPLTKSEVETVFDNAIEKLRR